MTDVGDVFAHGLGGKSFAASVVDIALDQRGSHVLKTDSLKGDILANVVVKYFFVLLKCVCTNSHADHIVEPIPHEVKKQSVFLY